MELELKGIEKSYSNDDGKRYHVLRKLDLHIQDGEMAAILGKSGSGKSTLLNIIGLMETMDSGQYILDGKDISKEKRKWSRIRNKRIGYVFQDYALLSNLSVFDNIAAPMYIAHKPYAAVKERVGELAEELKISHLLQKRIRQLSGGEKQRAAIARAMVMKPDFILADEPTGALDKESAGNVLKILQKINLSGTTVIVVTHDFEIAKGCDRVYRLMDGKLGD